MSYTFSVPLFHYFKAKNVFTSSHNNMRLRIAGGEELTLNIWPEPWCFQKTKEENIETFTFEFSQKGLDKLNEFLPKKYVEFEKAVSNGEIKIESIL